MAQQNNNGHAPLKIIEIVVVISTYTDIVYFIYKHNWIITQEAVINNGIVHVC